jgi:aminocarboxymuconate-semialdehyde decarboxylase
VIDVHAHAVLALTEGAAGAAGPELGASPDGTPFYRVGDYYLHGVKYAGSPFMDVDVRLAAMDAAGIDLQVLSPHPFT